MTLKTASSTTSPSRAKSGSPDFRRFLQEELLRRTRVNPRYSLRAFARALDVQSGFLSKILLGQRRVTATTVRRFGTRLGLGPAELEPYLKSLMIKPEGESAPADFQQIAQDHFQVLSDWSNFAILELALVDGFDPSPRGVARALGISVVEAQAAIERLQRLGFLQIREDGSWQLQEGHTTTLGTEETSAALRQLQRMILEKSIQALEEVSVHRRDHTGMTMAVDSTKLPEARERIKKFRRSLCAFLEEGETKDAVYQIQISLFPLTRERNEK